MAQYIVKHDQNIWDIAIQLYGSVEGLLPLLIANPKLSMTTQLKGGDILEYYDGVLAETSVLRTIQKNGDLIANSERRVYAKTPEGSLRAMFVLPNDSTTTAFKASGEGVIEIDWGDNTEIERITLKHSTQYIEHIFNNIADERKLKLYGDFSLTELDLTSFNGSMYPVTPIIVDSFISIGNVVNLDCLFLLKNMVALDLSYSRINTLKPIYDYGISGGLTETYNGLQSLDLTGVQFGDISVLDDYLEYIAGSKTHGGRRPCKIKLSTLPSDRGRNAIKRIMNEPEWNEVAFGSNWEFIINNQIYIPEDNDGKDTI